MFTPLSRAPLQLRAGPHFSGEPTGLLNGQETSRSPRFPGVPCRNVPRSSTPEEEHHPDQFPGGVLVPSVRLTTSASSTGAFVAESRSPLPRCLRFAAVVAHGLAQDSLPAGLVPLAGQDLHLQGLDAEFQGDMATSHSNGQGFAWRTKRSRSQAALASSFDVAGSNDGAATPLR